MRLSIDLDLLRRVGRALPYLTDEDEEIDSIAELLQHKLVEASQPDRDIEGKYVGPAVVRRIRPRGMAALDNDGDTLI